MRVQCNDVQTEVRLTSAGTPPLRVLMMKQTDPKHRILQTLFGSFLLLSSASPHVHWLTGSAWTFRDERGA